MTDQKICKRHPHNTEEGARKCYERALRKRADIKLKYRDPPRFQQKKNAPPRVEIRGDIEIYIFYEAEIKPWRT